MAPFPKRSERTSDITAKDLIETLEFPIKYV
jgi:hypothetical protein